MKFNQVFLQLQAVSVIHTVTVLGRYSLDSKCETHSDSGQNTLLDIGNNDTNPKITFANCNQD